jgi:hypothetical protein
MRKDRAKPPNSMRNYDVDASKVWVFYNGSKRFDVLEYNVSEGWILIRKISGYAQFRHVTQKRLYGRITVAWKDIR